MCVLLYRVYSFYFSWQFKPLKTQNSWVVIDERPQGSANGPVEHSWKYTFLQVASIVTGGQYCYRLPVLLQVASNVTGGQYCTKSADCFLKVNDSTPVFMSYFILMCN